jgi:hypothetical protein
MASSLEPLKQTAQFLRNAAPREFDQFRSAFEKYNAECVRNLLNASTNIKQLQGHLQQCDKIYSMLKEIN